MAFAKTLWQSICRFSPAATLHVLVTDRTTPASASEFNQDTGLICHDSNTVLTSPTAKGIYKKYAAGNKDRFRWALKPVFIAWLLESGYNKVIYLDSDIYFTSNPDFLFKELDTAAILLTPHWRNTNPLISEDGLFSVLRDGLFNAGFVGASASGASAMNWWAELCHYRTEKAPELGLYDDQKYLDLMSVEFENVSVLKHRGCNLAAWNIDTNFRKIIDGELKINSTYDPVFIHFTKDTIYNIQKGNDVLLKPFLEQYYEQLRAYNWQGDLLPLEKTFLYTLKQNTRIRTRLKRFFFWLSQRL